MCQDHHKLFPLGLVPGFPLVSPPEAHLRARNPGSPLAGAHSCPEDTRPSPPGPSCSSSQGSAAPEAPTLHLHPGLGSLGASAPDSDPESPVFTPQIWCIQNVCQQASL